MPHSASAPDRAPRRGRAVALGITAAVLAAAVLAAVLLWPGRGEHPLLSGGVRIPRPLWSADVPAEFAATASIRQAGDMLVVTSVEGVLAYRAATGELLWRWDADGGEFYTLVTPGSVVLVHGNQGEWPSAYDVLDPATGRTRWHAGDLAAEAEPFDVGLLLTATSTVLIDCVWHGTDLSGPPPYDGRCTLTARALADGAPLWTRTVDGQSVVLTDYPSPGQEHNDGTFGFTEHSDVPDTDTRFVVVKETYGGGVTVVSIDTGEVVGTWQDSRDRVAYHVNGGVLYALGLYDDLLHGVDPATGAELWTRELRADRALVLPLASGPADVYFDVAGDSRSCRFVDLATGDVRGVEAAGWPLLAITPDVVAGYDGAGKVLTAVEPGSGRPLWTLPLDLGLGGGEQRSSSFADTRRLVLTATPRRDGAVPPRTWLVDLSNGRTGTLPEAAIGYENGLLATLTGESGTYTLRLRALT